jgi:hypothetical protein
LNKLDGASEAADDPGNLLGLLEELPEVRWLEVADP